MRITLPYPPSGNRYWRLDKRHGHLYRSPVAKKYIEGLEAIVREQMGQRVRFPVFRGPVAVALVLFRPQASGDLDNFEKILLDALKGVAYVDDSQVVRKVADREDSKLNPRVEVLVQPRQLAGQQTALDLIEAENPAAEPRHEFFDVQVKLAAERLAVVTEFPRLTARQLAAKARPNVVRSSTTQHAQED